MSSGRSGSGNGVRAAIAAIAVTAGLGAVGVAYAAQDETISADDGLEFTPPEVTIQVGEKVTWTFDNPTIPHNVVAKPDSPTPWSTGDATLTTNHADVGPITFPTAGTYTFYCQAHGGMDGTVIVGDGGTPTPTPTPTSTATPTPTPTPTPTATTQPGGGGHTTTPPPTGGGGDNVKPSLRSVGLKALRRAVRVRFRLSEPATVTVSIKRRGSRKVLKSARLQARAGMRTVTLRSKRLRKGRYTIEIRARDAFGNRSSLATKRLTLRK